ncbi:hypothetical protein FEM03_13865 [Phragmitibacter flavus]|uniref:Transporter n=1 Tax=Phragmitibacter flavus TaxID=2576071 RepID=A0A5R8KDF3_9BACT|nr:hypothetical protein [Phragmitibacter flavus]TLD70267.1 hypothetical protein FEM03_13865 [Phragmitibacter flavus]
MNPIKHCTSLALATAFALSLTTTIPSSLTAGTTDAKNVAPVTPEATFTSESWWTMKAHLGYESLHVYRGVDSSGGLPIIWGALDLTLFDALNLSLFKGNDFDGDYNELTPTISFTHDLGFVSATAGLIWYTFPDEDGLDSEEYFLKLSRDLPAGFNASLWLSYNPNASGWYNEFKVSHLLPLTDRLSLATSTTLGWSEGQRSGGSGLDNLTFAVGLPITLTKNLTLTPLGGYAFALEALESDDEAWAGITLTLQF